MKEGNYYSKKWNTKITVYPMPFSCECSMCGKVRKNLTAVVRWDDEQHLEYVFGSECLKSLQIVKA